MNIVIAIWHYRPHVGGAERKAELFARTLARQGHDVTVITGRRNLSWPAKETHDGVRVRRLWPGRHLATALRMAWWVWRRRRRIELIHGFVINAPTVAVGLAAGKYGIPMTVAPASMGFHSDMETLKERTGTGFMADVALKLPWKVAASTTDMEQELIRRGFAKYHIFVRPTGVFVPTEAELPPLPDRERTVVVVGRLAKVKGPDVALEAWRTVHAKHPGWQLVFIGGGDMQTELEERARTDGLGDSVTFAGAGGQPVGTP